jgi:hypothetical protein
MDTIVNSEILPITRRGASHAGFEFSMGRAAATGTESIGPEIRYKVIESDERSLQLTEIDLSKIHFQPTVPKGHKGIRGEDILKNLKADSSIRLDVEILFALIHRWRELDNQDQKFPLLDDLWDYEDQFGLVCLHFDGTIYESQIQKSRQFSQMMYLQVGQWYKGMDPLDHHRGCNSFSVLYRP